MSPPLKLPQEIWCLIAECLKPDKQSLSRLCQSANDMYTILLPTLYDQVHLSYPSAITEFCNTIVGKPSKLAPLVRCLQVGDHFEPCDYNQCPRFGRNDSARLHKDLAIQFRSLLELVLNLRELYLVATPRALNLCLADVKAPFKLRRLEISCVISKPFYAFLRGQSLVTRLQVFPNSRQASNTMSDLLTQNPDILPHVQIATGSIYFLNAISSSRPLSEVTITDETPSLSYRDELDRYLEYLSRLFSESNVNSVGWFRSETPEVPDLWEDIIARIKKKGPHKNIRRITVIDTPKILNTIRHPQHFDRQLKLVGRTSGFDNLESIEIIRAHHEAEPEETVLSWLEEFRSLGTWIGYIPSLKRVHIYGVDLR